MPLQRLARIRLHLQQLTETAFDDPAKLTSWFGAMQAQDYAHVRWALGVRLPATTDAAVSDFIDSGKIIRTHILRPTWHLVAAEDIGWMLDLSGPRVSAQIQGMHHRVGLPAGIFNKSHAIIEKALEGGRFLTRNELVAALGQAGIPADLLQATHLMMQAELDGLICNGPMRGKQFTYALLGERAPNAARMPREEALAMLVQRYFQSHGPATLQDFTWWSGLTLADAKAGIEAVKSGFVSETLENQTYWMPRDTIVPDEKTKQAHLLPSFDEFMIAYKDRAACLDPQHKDMAVVGNGIFKPILVIDGKVKGIWQRSLKKDRVSVEIYPFSALSANEKESVEEKAEAFGRFLKASVQLEFFQTK